jgi:hypothetical protein
MITELNKRPGPWMNWKSHWKKSVIIIISLIQSLENLFMIISDTRLKFWGMLTLACEREILDNWSTRHKYVYITVSRHDRLKNRWNRTTWFRRYSLDLYSVGARFDTRPNIGCSVFRCLPQSPQGNVDIATRLGHEYFLQIAFHHFLHHSIPSILGASLSNPLKTQMKVARR